jgi:hypothetical protein
MADLTDLLEGSIEGSCVMRFRVEECGDRHARAAYQPTKRRDADRREQQLGYPRFWDLDGFFGRRFILRTS